MFIRTLKKKNYTGDANTDAVIDSNATAKSDAFDARAGVASRRAVLPDKQNAKICQNTYR